MKVQPFDTLIKLMQKAFDRATYYSGIALFEVIEKLTGRMIGDYMASMIFEPLGMNDTVCFCDSSNDVLKREGLLPNVALYNSSRLATNRDIILIRCAIVWIVTLFPLLLLRRQFIIQQNKNH